MIFEIKGANFYETPIKDFYFLMYFINYLLAFGANSS